MENMIAIRFVELLFVVGVLYTIKSFITSRKFKKIEGTVVGHGADVSFVSGKGRAEYTIAVETKDNGVAAVEKYTVMESVFHAYNIGDKIVFWRNPKRERDFIQHRYEDLFLGLSISVTGLLLSMLMYSVK